MKIYIVDLQDESSFKYKYLLSRYKIHLFGIANWNILRSHYSQLAKYDIIHGLLKLIFGKDHISEACIKGEHANWVFKPKLEVSTS